MTIMKSLIFIQLAIGTPAFAGQDSADLARSVFNNNYRPAATTTTTGDTHFPTAMTPPPPPTTGGAGVNESTGGNKAATGVIKSPGANSIHPAANQGQASQSGGAGANAAAGAALIAAGAMLMSNPPTVPPGAILMAMGILAMMQSGHDSDAANKSANTSAASLNGLGSNAINPAANPAANPELGNGKSGYIADANKALGAAGYKMTKDGLVGPDGKLTPSSAFSSPAAMAKAGLSADTIKEVGKVTAAVNQEASKVDGASVSGVALSEGGGSGSTNDRAGNSSDTHGSNANANPWALNGAERKAMVAGKTVLFDGDPIGVRGQNIFDMIHTCYEKKRSRNDFIESEGGVLVRAPASTGKPVPYKAPSFGSKANIK